MASQQTVFRCLVISPGDVDDARDAAEAAIRDWNAHVGPTLDARVEAVRWESHARPEMGGSAQDQVNAQLVDGCDFGVALFWSRLGTPTKNHESGSVEEVYRLVQSDRRVLIYFCREPIPQGALKDDQFARLKEVRDRFRQEGLLGEYSNVQELTKLFTLHLASLIPSLLLRLRNEDAPIPSVGTVTAPMPDVRVSVRGAFVTANHGVASLVAITVANHSPVRLYLSSIVIELTGGHELFIQQNAATGDFNSSRTLEPGDSYDFYVQPGHLLEAQKGRDLVCAVARDKIGRRFRSRRGELLDVMSSLGAPTRRTVRAGKRGKGK